MRDLRVAARAPSAGRAQHDEQSIGAAPAQGLDAGRDPGFDRERVGQEAQDRTEVRQREKPVHPLRHQRVGVFAREPALYQRAGGRQHEVRQADGGDQQAENAPQGVFGAARFPAGGSYDRQRHQAGQQERDMQAGLGFRPQAARKIRIGIAGQERQLKKHQAGGPHSRRTAEPRQDLLGDDRLHQEQEKAGNQDRGRVEEHGRETLQCREAMVGMRGAAGHP